MIKLGEIITEVKEPKASTFEATKIIKELEKEIKSLKAWK